MLHAAAAPIDGFQHNRAIVRGSGKGSEPGGPGQALLQRVHMGSFSGRLDVDIPRAPISTVVRLIDAASRPQFFFSPRSSMHSKTKLGVGLWGFLRVCDSSFLEYLEYAGRRGAVMQDRDANFRRPHDSVLTGVWGSSAVQAVQGSTCEPCRGAAKPKRQLRSTVASVKLETRSAGSLNDVTWHLPV